LVETGFTHLALEMEPQFSVVLNEYVENQIDARTLEDRLKAAGRSLFNDKSACPTFFSLLDTAKAFGLRIVAIDKDHDPKKWRTADYASEPREDYMANEILRLFIENGDARVVVLGGANHMYVREPAPHQHLSMAEIVRNQLALRGHYFLSVGGVIYSEQAVADLTFKNLYPRTLPATQRAVRVSECPNLTSVVLGNDRRCPWGGCFVAPIDECIGLSFGICGKIPESEIKAGFWDFLVFHERNWGGEFSSAAIEQNS
jgi:hypothetical protein